MKLEEIAQVMIGVLTKREKSENGGNSYLLFSLKNYEEEKEYEEFRTNKDLNNKQAQKGDLLFRLLYPNKIIYVNDSLEGVLIPSQFCIIRPIKEKVNPIVLKWYLESKQAEKDLKSRVTGSIIKSMPVNSLKDLEVPNIPLDRQKQIQELIELWDKEKEITNQIIKEKAKLYNFYIGEIIKRSK